MEVSADSRPHPSTVPALLGAAHPGPALAVTVLAALLGTALDLTPDRVVLVTAAVLCGQLSIGWSNDLVDLARDRAVGRSDKPLALGTISPRTVTVACAVAVVLCVVLSLACGWVAGIVHLGCTAAGWAYNLGLKATVWSWAPYALAFGGLPVFVWLAGDDPGLPPWWLPLAAACLGVGAHLLNVLPDIDDDLRTGVRGLPHRLGATGSRIAAGTLLAAASLVLAVGPPGPPGALGVGAVAVAIAAAVGAGVLGRRPGSRAAFLGVLVVAAVDVALLLASGRGLR